VLRGLACLRVVTDLKNPPARLLDQARVRDGAFDIGMFRSYWERAAKLTGEKIADLTVRPMPSADPPTDAPPAGAPAATAPSAAAGTIPLTGRPPTRPAVITPPGCVELIAGHWSRPTSWPSPPAGPRTRTRRSPMPVVQPTCLRDDLGRDHPIAPGFGHNPGVGVDHRPRRGDLAVGEPIGDVADAVARLRRAGVTTAFATNNSAPTTQDLLDRLDRVGILAASEDLASSAAAAASLLQPGDTAFVLAEGGVLEALAARGVKVGGEGPVDAVVVGWTHSFEFRPAGQDGRRRPAERATDRYQRRPHPPDSRRPGSRGWGAAGGGGDRLGGHPADAGKPHRPMADHIRRNSTSGSVAGRPWPSGDQPRTDGRLAEQLGIPFALVDSGVTKPGTEVDGVAVSVRTADFVTLVEPP